MAKVSVIIPVHNAAKFLGACLDSVLGQEFKDIEVICIDDSSTDCSATILAEYALADSRVKSMVGRESRGAGAARNAGLEVASGDWLHFVDADDLVRPVCAAAAVACGEAEGADVVVFGAEELDESTGWLTPLPLDLSVKRDDPRILKSYATSPWNKLFRRSFVERCGIRFQEIARANDLAFVVEALCRADKVAVLERSLYRYRIHTGVSLQDTKDRTPNAGDLALDEARRRLEACGVLPCYARALDVLAEDVRATARPRSLVGQVVTSIRRRGIVSFAKHAVGRLLRGRLIRATD